MDAQHEALAKRMAATIPDLCLDCGRQLRLAFWPFGSFYARQCDFTKKPLITIISPQVKFPVYHRDIWNSDEWQVPMREINLNTSFTQQLTELQQKTPHVHAFSDEQSQNCDYCDDYWESKNCYLTRSIAQCENAHYCYRCVGVKDSLDITFSFNLEQCYECVYCFDSYNLKYSKNCRNCRDSWLLYDCRGCQDCVMCWNLRNQKYCIANQKYTATQYKQKVATLKLGSRGELQKWQAEFNRRLQVDAVHRPDNNVQAENCQGNFIERSKNAVKSSLIAGDDNVYDLFRCNEVKDTAGSAGVFYGELNYWVVQSTYVNKLKYSMYCANCYESEYLDQCNHCNNCFGCVGLRKKKFCILNQQYDETAYFALKDKIVEAMKRRGEYGKFFLLAAAYGGYNLSLAQLYYPLSEKAVNALGGWWENPELSTPRTILERNIPDSAPALSDHWINKVLECQASKRPFKIIRQEVEFYKKQALPLPIFHSDVRNQRRYVYMQAVQHREVSCAKCGKRVVTYYPEKWGYKNVYCEKCYNKEIN